MEIDSMEKVLWSIVLSRTFKTAAGIVPGLSGIARRRCVDEARDWIMNDSDREGGYVWVCDIFGYDPERGRKWLKTGIPAVSRDIGGILYAYRQRFGITQEQLAEAAGVSVGTVSRIEGNSRPGYNDVNPAREKLEAFIKQQGPRGRGAKG